MFGHSGAMVKALGCLVQVRTVMRDNKKLRKKKVEEREKKQIREVREKEEVAEEAREGRKFRRKKKTNSPSFFQIH